MKVSDTDIELWTVDIADRPAMVFGAVSLADAIAKVSAKSAIRNDLAIFKDSHGRPIWNGVDPLSVREVYAVGISPMA